MSMHMVPTMGDGLLVVSISGTLGCGRSSLGRTMQTLLESAGWHVLLRDESDPAESDVAWRQRLAEATRSLAREGRSLAVISVGRLG